jgi:AcrR family transcriptional regulator
MQDLLDELQLSKGAIYHHFKSKEDILAVVIEHWNQQEIALVSHLAAHVEGANAKEKIRNLSMAYLVGLDEMYAPGAEVFMSLQPEGPQFVLNGVMASVQIIAPIFAKLFEEGVTDGSIQTDYPLEIAEIFMLLFGFWTKPTVFGYTELETKRRLKALKDMFTKIGIDILTDELIEKLLTEYRRLCGFREAEPII